MKSFEFEGNFGDIAVNRSWSQSTSYMPDTQRKRDQNTLTPLQTCYALCQSHIKKWFSACGVQRRESALDSVGGVANFTRQKRQDAEMCLAMFYGWFVQFLT
jgi:hypothetical protein